MAKDPAFLFYPGDYLRDTQCLSEAVQVAYDRIMCEHMRNICISQQQLNFFTKKLSAEEKNELLMVLTKVEGGYQITWVAESISKRKAYSDSRRNNRKGKIIPDVKNICESHDSHMENENENENVLGEKKVKEEKGWNNFPGPADTSAVMLNETEIERCLMFYKSMKGILLSKAVLLQWFQAFKISNFSSKKYYADRHEVITHFQNWIKNQKAPNERITGKSNQQIGGLDYSTKLR